MARESRIFVEGRHDAELVEKVWGDDLRLEGVVVEYLGGVDDLVGQRCATSAPARSVASACWSTTSSPGSKESRIADDVRRSPVGEHVLVVGHPFVDVWAGVKPERLGLAAWPDVPRDVEWKHGDLRGAGLAARATRPTSPAPGGRSSAASRRTPTASRPCSAGSRS